MRSSLAAAALSAALSVLAACAPDPAADARAYADGLHAGGYGEARDACRRIGAPDLRGDCLVAAMERHGRLEMAECDAIPSGLWREECRFLFAERAARAGRGGEALHACASTRFARSCSYHLIRQAVERHAGIGPGVIEAAAAEAARLPEMPLAPDAAALFWRDWWRGQLRGGGEIDARRCPPTPAVAHPGRPDLPACAQGAREALEAVMEIRVRTRPAGSPCGAPPGLPWPDAEPMRGWASGVAARLCQGSVGAGSAGAGSAGRVTGADGG